jgi:hypothetical protein
MVKIISPAFSSRFAIVEIEVTPKAFSGMNSIIELTYAYPDAAHSQSPGSRQHAKSIERGDTRGMAKRMPRGSIDAENAVTKQSSTKPCPAGRD